MVNKAIVISSGSWNWPLNVQHPLFGTFAQWAQSYFYFNLERIYIYIYIYNIFFFFCCNTHLQSGAAPCSKVYAPPDVTYVLSWMVQPTSAGPMSWTRPPWGDITHPGLTVLTFHVLIMFCDPSSGLLQNWTPALCFLPTIPFLYWNRLLNSLQTFFHTI